MKLNEYQDAAGEFVLASAKPEERILGFQAEAGEVAGVFQRNYRGHYETEGEFLVDLVKELGDTLWYMSRLAADYNISLEEIALMNISKLRDRKQRKMLQGKGDNR